MRVSDTVENPLLLRDDTHLLAFSARRIRRWWSRCARDKDETT